MGSSSIDISQYRSRIGTFSRHKSTSNTVKASLGKTVKTNNIMQSFVMLSYLLVLSNVTQTLLIISGVESNPGPATPGKKYLMNISTFLRNLLWKQLNHLSNFLFCLYHSTYRYKDCKEQEGR